MAQGQTPAGGAASDPMHRPRAEDQAVLGSGRTRVAGWEARGRGTAGGHARKSPRHAGTSHGLENQESSARRCVIDGSGEVCSHRVRSDGRVLHPWPQPTAHARPSGPTSGGRPPTQPCRIFAPRCRICDLVGSVEGGTLFCRSGAWNLRPFYRVGACVLGRTARA